MTSNNSKDRPDQNHAAADTPDGTSAAHGEPTAQSASPDTAARTEQILRETLSGKAVTYFADGRTPPATDFPEFNEPPEVPSINLAEGMPKSKLRRQHVAIAAVTALGLAAACAAIVGNLGGDATVKVDDKVVPAGQTHQNDRPEDNPKRQLTQTHKGPARVVNYPFTCPPKDPSQPQLAGVAGSEFPSTPVDPISYCAEKGMLGNIDRNKAVVGTSQGHLFITDRAPGATASPNNSEEKNSADLNNISLPTGVTYTGLDYEVVTVMQDVSVSSSMECPRVAQLVDLVKTKLQEVPGSQWIAVVAGPLPASSNAHCHDVRPDLRTRSVVIREAVGSEGNAYGARHKDAHTKHLNKIRPVLEAVNQKCLSLDEAVSVTKTTAESTGILREGTPAVSRAVASGRKCARVHATGSNFMIFGK